MFNSERVLMKTNKTFFISLEKIARKEDDPKEALVEFQSVVDTEEEKGDW